MIRPESEAWTITARPSSLRQVDYIGRDSDRYKQLHTDIAHLQTRSQPEQGSSEWYPHSAV
eukprot:1704573-Rhodomonas_salina.3